MTREAWQALILILVEQIAILGVLLLQALESAREQQWHRERAARIEARLVELNARLGRVKEERE